MCNCASAYTAENLYKDNWNVIFSVNYMKQQTGISGNLMNNNASLSPPVNYMYNFLCHQHSPPPSPSTPLFSYYIRLFIFIQNTINHKLYCLLMISCSLLFSILTNCFIFLIIEKLFSYEFSDFPLDFWVVLQREIILPPMEWRSGEWLVSLLIFHQYPAAIINVQGDVALPSIQIRKEDLQMLKTVSGNHRL